MNLVVDIGNTFIKIAVFEKDVLVYTEKFRQFRVKDLKNLRKKYPFTLCISSSVRKSDPYFIQHLSRNYHLLLLSHKTKVPIKNLYKTPKTLGLDRLAAVVGATNQYPGKNILVIDIGTCMTFDFIDKERNYLGGNISPGVELRLNAMHHFTSSLPLVQRKNNKDILGKSTKEALQNGAFHGLKYEIEGFIKNLTKKNRSLTVILTGGDAVNFGETLESKIFVDPNLVLKGLNDILTYNN
ncbi:MAG: type III pantothenate kinase [Saprospiraceae bacterium]|nr:type III pantothenate kinase [Saprospiraceae bacterium]